MNSQTKILVIPLKTLIICIALVALAIITFIIFLFVGKNKDTIEDTPRASTTSANVSNMVTYSPGVYSASFTLNGTPVDIQVTVDEHNINSIEMLNLSDSITTMYPMLDESFTAVKNAVIENNSTSNVLYESDNKYTSTIFLEAIQAALDKCTVR
ncbi:MAG: hypothetical protein ACI4E1_05980 [Lachnospira sp.]